MARKRRAKGTGRVYQYPPKSSIWWAQLPEKDGKSGPKWRVPDKQTGEAQLAERLREMNQGVRVYERADTFGEWVMHCIEGGAATIGVTTYETYRQQARLYILSQPIAKIRMADLNIQDVRNWLAGISKVESERTKRRLSANTIRRAYNLITMSVSIAFDDRRISWLTPKKPKLPKLEEVEQRALTMEECNLLIEAATNERLALMYKTFIATGMRESELIGLQWSMIDWKRSEIKLTSQLKRLREGKRWERLPLKNRKRRIIPLDAELLTELRAHHTKQMRAQLKAIDWQDNGLVFPTSKGTPYSPRNLIDDLKRDAAKASIGDVTVHQLRHTAGSLMLQAGQTMTTVSKILGHSSVGITERTYAHAFDEDKRDAVTQVTRRLRRVGGAE